ncbi:Hrp-dependent type III effector protein [Pullulanibacillus camelliae]|uniref:Hrp-dependent type III effector protein n=1 Tax=Pullulanibacillus camelliae TaxID=1707096 RepID=A0A8J3E057_9BACL|nr:four-carbon acid sugar kinase family protein [Pullulanibacillus camelliae]GGE52981.1 Hrp-dependent type III effector protein [Pullulanibacillus camelliae]
MKLAMIADDLTGANDSGVQLARYGIDTSVLFKNEVEALTKHEGIVIDTDSRSLSKEEAYKKVREAAEFLKQGIFDVIYKKVDSTLRGNVGVEINALYDSFQPDVVIIAPAFPKNRRFTKDGHHYLNDKRLNETEIALDPKTPVKESYIPKLLEEQTGRRIGLINYNELNGDNQDIIKQIKNHVQNGIHYIVFDAVHEEDLKKLATIGVQSQLKVCWVGSAGLANYLPEAYHLKQRQIESKAFSTENPVMLVVGSVSQVTRTQLDKVLEASALVGLELDSVAIVTDAETRQREIERIIKEATLALENKKDLALYSSGSREDIIKAQEVGHAHGLDERQVSNAISEALGHVAAALVETFTFNGLVLTGGDTAKQVCNQLNVAGFNLIDEVETGIPLGLAIGEKQFFAITKAGAFGTDYSLLNSIKKLQGDV